MFLPDRKCLWIKKKNKWHTICGDIRLVVKPDKLCKKCGGVVK